MDQESHTFTRRNFLGATVAGVGAVLAHPASAVPIFAQQPATAPERQRPLRVAAINSIFRFRSHSYHIVGRLVHGYKKDGFHHQPPFQVVRMFNDQYPKDDLSRSFCKTHNIELCKTAAETLGKDGGLDVDAVLLIVEHGDYPLSEFGQVMYPRYEYFQQIVDVFKKNGKSVPTFCDKHLSYDHKKAAEMVATLRKLGFPMMAGSSLPVTWRIPEIEPPRDTPFREGLALMGYDRGPAEIYLFHALEVLQCMMERRKGGETGVKSVTGLIGDAVWKAADQGLWSWKLYEAALSRSPGANVGPTKENVTNPQAILVEYNDGTRGTVLNFVEQSSDFSFAASVAGRTDPISACFFLPPPPGANFFNPLTWNIEKFFQSGKPTYPVERTLLTSTVLDIALHSQKDGGKPISSPALDIRYHAPESTGFFRGPWVEGV